MDRIQGEELRSFLLTFADLILRSKDELNSMDAECGDGDFGSGMFMAFSDVRKTLVEAHGDDIGVLLTKVGHSILSIAGGASGPMFGTLFLEAGKLATGKNEVGATEIALMLDQSLHRIRARGGARVGDKTLVDALEPAVSTLKEILSSKIELHQAFERAAEAAREGCESTKRLTAKHGKARYLGEQTLGFVDPGAYVISLLFTTLAASKVVQHHSEN